MTWSDHILGELLRVKHGFAFKGAFFEESGPYVVLTPGNFHEGGGFRARDGKDRSYSGDFPADYILHKGDVVVAMTEQGPGLLGSSAIVPEDETYLHNQRIGLLHEIDEFRADKLFLYYLFNTRSVRGQISGSATGTKVRHTAPERIYRVRVRLPSLIEQRKIASTIKAYDDLIENNRRRIALLEEAARLLYREWFVRFRFPGHEHVTITDGVPLGWEPYVLSEIADILRGKSYTSDELVNEGGQPFINLKCFERYGGFRSSGLKHFRGGHKPHHLVAPGDIVVAVTDMTREAMIVAQAARIPRSVGDNAIFSMDVVKVLPKRDIQPEWLYSTLRYSSFSLEVRELATGTTVLHLKPKHIEGQRIVVPPYTVREMFAEVVRDVFNQQDLLELQCQKLAQARDLLLPRIMDGRIEI